jgi:TolA-binding protein
MSTELKNKAQASDLLPNEQEVTYEEVQQFFARNKVWIIGFILILLLSIGGYVLWQKQEANLRDEAQLKFAQAKTTEELQAVTTQYADTEGAALASLALGDRYFQQSAWDKALASYQTIIEKHPNSPLLPSALVGEAAVLDAQGKSNEALAKYLTVTQKYSKSFQAPQALYSAARIHHRLGQLKEARQMYNDLMVQYPESSWKKDAEAHFKKLSSLSPEK